MKSGSLVPRLPLVAVLVALVMLASGCVSPSQTPAQKRQGIIEMKNEVLEDLYRIKPDVRAQMAKASGYGVFSNAKIHWLLASVGGGYGMVVDNSTGRATYMKMGELGVGPGIGLKDFRVVMVFHNPRSLDHFIQKGWVFGGNADAAAKAGGQGAAVGIEEIAGNVTVYQLTESGLALQATIKGAKFWVDTSLN